jgi:hypothetical protein
VCAVCGLVGVSQETHQTVFTSSHTFAAIIQFSNGLSFKNAHFPVIFHGTMWDWDSGALLSTDTTLVTNCTKYMQEN